MVTKRKFAVVGAKIDFKGGFLPDARKLRRVKGNWDAVMQAKLHKHIGDVGDYII
jgi:hypothetical protein